LLIDFIVFDSDDAFLWLWIGVPGLLLYCCLLEFLNLFSLFGALNVLRAFWLNMGNFFLLTEVPDLLIWLFLRNDVEFALFLLIVFRFFDLTPTGFNLPAFIQHLAPIHHHFALV
jgi:hypothetical protein